jgi:hypothetical protein
MVSSQSFGVQIYLATYMRLITLIAQFLLGRASDSDRSSRALTQSAVKILFSLPICASF